MSCGMNLSLALACACLSLVSCASRLSCDKDAPAPTHRDAHHSSGSSTEMRVTDYIRGHRAADFELEQVKKIRVLPTCGMPLLRSMVTLGLIPVTLPHPTRVEVSGRSGGRRVTRVYRLYLEQQTSVWQRLVPSGRDDRMMASALLQAINEGRMEPADFKF